MHVKVVEVKRSENSLGINLEDKTRFREFMEFPRVVYANNNNWVETPRFDEKKPFDPKGAFLEHASMACYVAYIDNLPVGRVAAIYDHNFNEYHRGRANEPGLNGRTGFFGFFESLNDQRISDALFREAEQTLFRWGADIVLGPMDPSLNRRAGLLVEGEEAKKGFNSFELDPRILMAYNPRYYEDMLNARGFEKAKDLLAFKIDASTVPASKEKMDKLVERITRSKTKNGLPKVRARPIREIYHPKVLEDIKILGQLYNEGLAENWGFTPLTPRESHELGLDLAIFGGPNLTYIGEAFNEESGKYEPAGYWSALPDYNTVFKGHNGKITPSVAINFLRLRANPKVIRVPIGVIKPGYRKMGLDAIIYSKILDVGSKFGIQEGEQSWILEDNFLSVSPIIKSLGAEHYKTYRIYQKQIKV